MIKTALYFGILTTVIDGPPIVQSMGVLGACSFMNRQGGVGGSLPDQGVCAEQACAVETQFIQTVSTTILKSKIFTIKRVGC